MKYILLLSFLFTYQNIISKVDSNPNNFYCISNRVLKILPIDNGDKIFYGIEGGVLRNIKNGTEWVQNYSGTKSNIVGMTQNKGRVIGITINGYAMTSDDYGNWWKYQKLADTLIGVIVLDDLVITATKTDSLFISSDNGNTWVPKKIEISNIGIISSFNNQIIVNTQDFKIFVSNDIGNNWKEIPTPFYFRRVDCRNNVYSISGKSQIAFLNNDLTWKAVFLSTNSSYLTYISEDNNLITFSEEFNTPNYDFPKIKIYKYNLENNTNELVKTYENPVLGVGIPKCLAFAPYDVCKINNDYYLTTDYKTILKSNNLTDWEVVSHASMGPIISKFETKKWTIFPNYQPTIIYSTNQGATFSVSNEFNVNKDSTKYIPKIIDSYHLENGSIFYTSANEMFYFTKDKQSDIKNIGKVFAKSGDDGMTIKDIDIELPQPKGLRLPKWFRVLGYKNNKCYFYTSHLISSRVLNGNTYKDSLFKNYFYSIDMINETIDTLCQTDMYLSFCNILIDNDKIWLFGRNQISASESELYLSNDEGKNFKKVATFPQTSKFGSFYDTEHLYKSKNGRYFFMTVDSLYELDTSNYRSRVFNIGYDMIVKEYYSQIVGEGYFEDQYFLVTNQIEENKFESYFVKFELGDSISMNIEGDLETGFNPIRSRTGDYLAYFKNLGSNFNLYIPIEPDRLSYYTSVETTENRNYLWTNPPYPQPSNNQVKVEVYWDSDLPFTSDDVEIYDLTGIKLNINGQINVIKESTWKGKVIWDASNQNPGIYIMKITHGTETRTRKILITD